MRVMTLDTIYDRFPVDLHARRPGLDGEAYDARIQAIARAGQRPTLRDHTHARRTAALLELVTALPDRP